MLRKLGTVSGLTLASRIFGFLRDILLAATLGAGPMADAFMLAFRLPNHFRAIFAEGAFNAAFLPTWTATDARGGDTPTLGAQVLGWLVLANIALFALAVGATGWMLSVLAPGLTSADPTWPVTVTLTRITFPYLLCMSLVAFLSALLNARDRFAAAAGAPILLNLSMLATLLLGDHFPSVAHAAAWGVLIAGLAQVGVLAIAAVRAGIDLPRPRLGLSPATGTFFRRLGPAVLTAGALQIAIFADTVIATFLPTGSLSQLYYADRIYQLPIGLLGVALGTVILPEIGRRAALGDDEGMRRVLDRALTICLFVGAPITVIMALLGDWAIQILFVRGAFGHEEARASAQILTAYAVGLVPALGVRSAVAAFHGRGDTRTPLTLLVAATAVNLALKLVLAPVLGAEGLALATSAGVGLYAALLIRTGRRRGYIRGPRALAVVVVALTALTSAVWLFRYRAAILDAAGSLFAPVALPLAFLGISLAIIAVHGLAAWTVWIWQLRRVRRGSVPEK
ncbi:murein biosynthesis integral membrane protein MurJ [Roseobacter sp. HKCCA0434]|uniref:murein biosynthesis integral membrane protein MurJ n=1 Tax=Roseobacter sp. HKCCA0434 TaxID=3079297 RepID=UPI002905C773|nr:murein biosynthesis integral membrane protein MurJ [Roseobacter sp. HKCCA0434]